MADRALFREMEEEEGRPALGPDDLGARLGVDVKVDDEGDVAPASGGMSVAPDDPLNLHRAHRPPTLGGTGSKPVWMTSVETFSAPLTYRPDPRRPAEHGLVEPAERMPFDTYVAHLEKTQDSWERADV